jgi:hypothetical protein
MMDRAVSKPYSKVMKLLERSSSTPAFETFMFRFNFTPSSLGLFMSSYRGRIILNDRYIKIGGE